MSGEVKRIQAADKALHGAGKVFQTTEEAFWATSRHFKQQEESEAQQLNICSWIISRGRQDPKALSGA